MSSCRMALDTDQPGAAPFSTKGPVDRTPTSHYTHENPETGRIDAAKPNPFGVPDSAVKEFPGRIAARLWISEEWRGERLK
jgi:hypothetical protein